MNKFANMKKILFFVSIVTMLAFRVSAQDNTTIINLKKLGYSVEVPTGWLLQITKDDSTDIYAISDEGLSKTVGIYYGSLIDNGIKISFDQYCEEYIKHGNDSSLYKLDRNGKTVINGLDCYWMISVLFDGTNEEIRYIYNIGNDHIVYIVCYTQTADFERMNPLFTKVFKSLKRN